MPEGIRSVQNTHPQKSLLRKSLLRALKSQSNQTINLYSKLCLDSLGNNSLISDSTNIFIYSPIGNQEPDLTPLITEYPGKNIFLPRIEDGVMEFIPIKNRSDLVKGPLGFSQPVKSGDSTRNAEPEVVIIPSLALDTGGIRLGRGGGFYDRYFNNYKQPVHLMGFVPYFCYFKELPAESHDLRLNEINIIYPDRIKTITP